MKKFILLLVLSLSQVLGDIGLSRGMKQFGELKTINPSILLDLLGYAITNPWIWLGVGFLVSSLIFYLTAISRLDLSYVLPIHSSSYVLNALFAWLLLGESIPIIRWGSTILISIGVLLVSLSGSTVKAKNKPENLKSRNKNILYFLLPFGLSLSKTWLAILLIVLADSLGDVFLAMGMKKVGKVEITSRQQTLNLVCKILTNSAIISGIFCQALAFIIFICVLTWADISFVRPATALTYILSLLGAKYILQEKIASERLIGIIFVGFGIFIHR